MSLIIGCWWLKGVINKCFKRENPSDIELANLSILLESVVIVSLYFFSKVSICSTNFRFIASSSWAHDKGRFTLHS